MVIKAATRQKHNGYHRRSRSELSRILSNQQNRRLIVQELASGDLSQPVATTPKQDSTITADRIVVARRARYNPLRTLTPDSLTTHLEAFRMGYLWQAALDWDAMRRRDLILCAACLKREKAISRHGYEIVPDDNSDEAKRHVAVLKYFYANLSATDALDENISGGYSMLIRQMMRSVGFQHQVHEIIWKPIPNAVKVMEQTQQEDGSFVEKEVETIDGFQAEFRAVPLWFFECITGRLRYLRQFGELYGQPMEKGGWMVTSGDMALLEPSSVAYMFKNLTLKDWLSLSERWGDPKVIGIVDGKPDSPQWQAMSDAIHNISQEYAAVVSKGGEIKNLEGSTTAANAGEDLYAKLVDQMDRYITTLWRGGDLSTISHQGGGEGQGASLQGPEADILEVDDCDFIEEVLHQQVDHWVIRYTFGEEVQPKARIVIARPEKKSTDVDLKVDTFLTQGGAKQKNKDLAERYDRQVINPSEDFGAPPPQPAEPLPPEYPPQQKEKPKPEEPEEITTLSDEAVDTLKLDKEQRTTAEKFADGLAQANEPLQKRIAALKELSDDEYIAGWRKLLADFPDIAKQCLHHAGMKHAAEGLSEGITKAFFRGMKEKPIANDTLRLVAGFKQPLKNTWYGESERHAEAAREGHSAWQMTESVKKGVVHLEPDNPFPVNDARYHTVPSYRIVKAGDGFQLIRDSIEPVEGGYPKFSKELLGEFKSKNTARTWAQEDLRQSFPDLAKPTPNQPQGRRTGAEDEKKADLL